MRKGMKSKTEKKNEFKGIVVDDNISDTEVAWCSFLVTLPKGKTEMYITSYCRLNHDPGIDFLLRKMEIKPERVVKIEIEKIKKLTNAIKREPIPIKKWKIQKD